MIINSHSELAHKIADKVTSFCGSLDFVIIHALWWIGWVVFDIEQFPYGLLTMLVSLEAILLSTFILMSQNRQSEKDRDLMSKNYRLEQKSMGLIEEIHDSVVPEEEQK